MDQYSAELKPWLWTKENSLCIDKHKHCVTTSPYIVENMNDC